jgi:hypothetical protein
MLSVVTSEGHNPPHPHIREIVEQERIEQMLEDLGVSQLKLADLLEGLTDTIGKRPEVFEREQHTGWSRIIVKAFPPEIPLMRIWFTYDPDHVFIEAIEKLD